MTYTALPVPFAAACYHEGHFAFRVEETVWIRTREDLEQIAASIANALAEADREEAISVAETILRDQSEWPDDDPRTAAFLAHQEEHQHTRERLLTRDLDQRADGSGRFHVETLYAQTRPDGRLQQWTVRTPSLPTREIADAVRVGMELQWRQEQAHYPQFAEITSAQFTVVEAMI